MLYSAIYIRRLVKQQEIIELLNNYVEDNTPSIFLLVNHNSF